MKAGDGLERRPDPGAVVAVRLAPSHMKPGIIPPWAFCPEPNHE
jgi:hypothetical protein